MKSILYMIIGIFIGLLAAGILYLVASQPKGEAITLLPTSTPVELTIYVSGAVATPGVYTLPPGSRVEAAIQVAGGLVVGAQAERLNLAALLSDGQQVDVPGSPVTNHVIAGRVNINTASVAELGTLPGIGATTAQAIVDYRLQNGPFQFIQDLQKVPGIGAATYSGIQDFITTGP